MWIIHCFIKLFEHRIHIWDYVSDNFESHNEEDDWEKEFVVSYIIKESAEEGVDLFKFLYFITYSVYFIAVNFYSLLSQNLEINLCNFIG